MRIPNAAPVPGAPSITEAGSAAPRAAPLVRAGLRDFLDLDRFDVWCVVVLTLAAFLIRFASPVYPDFLSHPFQGSPVRVAGVGYPYNADGCTDVPVGAQGRDERRCGMVFDEVYFPVEAAKDLRVPAESYFEDHPPLAKSLMVPPIALFGFNTWTWRTTTAITGSLFVGLIYLIAIRLRRDRFFAFAAAGFVGLDGLAFTESRTGLIDMIAIFFVALLYYFFLLHWQARTRTQWRVTLYLVAVTAALALAAKVAAVAGIGVVLALMALRLLEPPMRRLVGRSGRLRPGSPEGMLWRAAGGRVAALHYLVATLVAVVVFSACFSRYLTIEHRDVYRFSGCTQSGGVQAPTPEVMPAATLRIRGATVLDPVRAVRNIVEAMETGLQYHATECRTHPYSSHWYTWPVMYHPVLFYYNDRTTTDGRHLVSSITNMGNPALWWIGIPALLFCVWRMTRGPTLWRLGVGVLGVGSLAAMIVLFHAAQQPDTESVRVDLSPLFLLAFAGMVLFAGAAAASAVLARRFVPGFIVFGYVVSWIMWIPGNARRVLFFYHALGMLTFLALALAYALTALRRTSVRIGGRPISLAPIAYGLAGTVVAAFVFFYPIWTAMPLDPADHAMRTWVDTW